MHLENTFKGGFLRMNSLRDHPEMPILVLHLTHFHSTSANPLLLVSPLILLISSKDSHHISKSKSNFKPMIFKKLTSKKKFSFDQRTATYVPFKQKFVPFEKYVPLEQIKHSKPLGAPSLGSQHTCWGKCNPFFTFPFWKRSGFAGCWFQERTSAAK